MDQRFWHKDNNSTPIIVAIGFALVALLGFLDSLGLYAPPSRQEEVATKGAKIMPFDLDQTMHHLQPLENGGLQMVTVKDPSNSTQMKSLPWPCCMPSKAAGPGPSIAG